MLRLSQNLLLGLLFLLQGMAPLIHAHPDGKVIRHGIHVDRLSEALLGVSDGQTTTRAREEESPGIGLATPKRNDERAQLPLVILPVPRAQPTALAQVRWAALLLEIALISEGIQAFRSKSPQQHAIGRTSLSQL